jgi:hypothetical protein
MWGDSESAPEGAMEVIGRQKRCACDFTEADVFECPGVNEVASPAHAAVEFLAGGRFPAREAADALSDVGIQKEQILSQTEELLVHREARRMGAAGNSGDPAQYAFVARMEM